MKIDEVLNNSFKKWFNGSKVVDENGNPLIVYHGALSDEQIDEFYPLTHFGTKRAANKRISDQIKQDNFLDSISSSIYPVYLRIKNPLKIIDNYQALHTISTLTNYIGFGQLDFMSHRRIALYNKNIFVDGKINTDNIKKYYNSNLYFEELKKSLLRHKRYGIISSDEIVRIIRSNFSTNVFISILKNHGYDGLYYKNKVEDKGSISWVVFNSKQIWPLYK